MDDSKQERGEIKFALLPQFDDNGDAYLMARWADRLYQTSFGVNGVEHHNDLTFRFQGQPLKLFEAKPPKSGWQGKDSFTAPSLRFSVDTPKYGYFRLEEEQALPASKQTEHIWTVKFRHYYPHHAFSVTSYYDMTIDLKKMEVRYVLTTKVDID